MGAHMHFPKRLEPTRAFCIPMSPIATLCGLDCNSHRVGGQVLKSKAGQIAAAGYTSLWLPPPSDSVSQQGYLPRDLYNLNSQYGSEGDLRDCISVLHENDLKVIADIVINHRCAHNQACTCAMQLLSRTAAV